MADIRIYDFEFNLLMVCGRYISSNWTLYYNEIGTFEAHFPIDDDISEVLFSNDYLVAVQDGKPAVITGCQIAEDIAVYGRTPNWLFSKRVTLPFEETEETTEKTVEDLTRAVIYDAYRDEGVVNAGTGGIVWGEAAGCENLFVLSRTDIQTTFDVIKECLAKDSAGHRLSFDTVRKAWIYTVFYGRELPIVISEDNLNAHDTEYNCDVLDYFSGGWFLEEQPEDEEGNKPDSVWVHIGDETKNGLYKWDCSLSGSASGEALDDLDSKVINRQLVMQSRNFVYGRDYELGDIVTVKVIKGKLEITAKKRINGVNIWDEHGDSGEQPIFEEV